MKSEGQLELGTRERVGKQTGLLLRLYQTELASDPTSRATESSRSNLIALRHTIDQMYGNAEHLGGLQKADE
jgi:hypothetical protein